MAISSVSAASNAASAAHVRSKAADSKTQAGAKDAKTEEANGTDSNGGSFQAVHSVVAGALGLEDPKASKPPETEKNNFYTAGKFLAAAGTIGTIISVLA